jgi:hypothetical protein
MEDGKILWSVSTEPGLADGSTLCKNPTLTMTYLLEIYFLRREYAVRSRLMLHHEDLPYHSGYFQGA